MKSIVSSILIILFCSTTICFAQKYASKADSLSALIISDVQDTSKLVHLCELTKEIFRIDPDTAFSIAEEALQLGTSILKDPKIQNNPEIIRAAKKGMAASYGGMGAYYYIKGEFTLALENQIRAVEIRKNIGDSIGLATSYNNIGIIFRDQGDHSRALSYYELALDINRGLGDIPKTANNLNNIGLVYVDLKDYDIALKYFNQAFILNQKLGDKMTSATNLNNIGIVYFHKKKYPDAVTYYQKAYKVNLEIENYPEVANNLNNLGISYQAEKDFDKALKCFLEALDYNQQLGNKYGTALNMGNAAGIYVEQKKYNDAKEYLNKALAIAEEIQAWQLIQDHNLTLSNLYSATNNYQLAFEHYRKYSAAKDTLFNDSKSKDIGRIEMKNEIEQAEKERIRAEEEKQRIAQKERERKNTLQYSGMILALVLIALIVVLLGFVKVSAPMARSITFFSFLLVFEFLLLFTDPWLDKFSGGEPVYKLILNVLLALLIFPINAALENALKKRLVKRGAEEKLK